MNLAQSILLILFVFFFSHTSAKAALVENVTIGNAKALSLAHAVTADPPGIDSIHFNPAGLTKLTNRQYSLKFLAGAFNFQTEFGERGGLIDECLDNVVCNLNRAYDDPLENSVSATKTPSLMLPVSGLTEMPIDALVAPFGGFSYSPEGSNLTFATTVYVPMGAGYKRGADDPGRFFGREFSLARITYLSPTIAYQANEHWSIGFGTLVSWQGVGLDMDLRVPGFATAAVDTLQTNICDSNALSAVFTICEGTLGPYDRVASLATEMEDAFSFSWNLGLLWEPNEWFSWGVVYQSEGKTELKGDYTLEYSQGWSDLFGGLLDEQRGNSATVGLLNLLESVTPIALPQGNLDSGPGSTRVETGTVTSRLASPAHFSTGVSVKITPRTKVNFDFKWTDWGSWETIRLDFDTNQIDFLKIAGLLPNQGLLVPLGGADLYTFGFSLLASKGKTIDFAYGYLKSNEKVSSGGSSNANSDALIYNPYAGLEFENTTTAHIIEFNYNAVF